LADAVGVRDFEVYRVEKDGSRTVMDVNPKLYVRLLKLLTKNQKKVVKK